PAGAAEERAGTHPADPRAGGTARGGVRPLLRSGQCPAVTAERPNSGRGSRLIARPPVSQQLEATSPRGRVTNPPPVFARPRTGHNRVFPPDDASGRGTAAPLGGVRAGPTRNSPAGRSLPRRSDRPA